MNNDRFTFNLLTINLWIELKFSLRNCTECNKKNWKLTFLSCFTDINITKQNQRVGVCSTQLFPQLHVIDLKITHLVNGKLYMPSNNHVYAIRIPPFFIISSLVPLSFQPSDFILKKKQFFIWSDLSSIFNLPIHSYVQHLFSYLQLMLSLIFDPPKIRWDIWRKKVIWAGVNSVNCTWHCVIC